MTDESGRRRLLAVLLAGFVLAGAGVGFFGPSVPQFLPGDGEAAPAPPTVTVTPPGGGGDAGGTTTTGTDPDDATTAGGTAAVELSFSVADPADVRNDVGYVGRLVGALDGSASWDARADDAVLVVSAWVPGEGWAELRRTTVGVDGDGRLDLPAALGGSRLVYATRDRTAAFDNPTDGTTVTRTGFVSVTAVLFDGDEAVGREQTVRAYEFDVTNVGRATATTTTTTNETNETGRPANGSDRPVDLSVVGGPEGVAFVAASDVLPGWDGERRIVLRNDGNATGTLALDHAGLRSDERGRSEPERRVDDTGGDPGVGRGELDEVVAVSVAVVGPDGAREYVLGGPDAGAPASALAGVDGVDLAELAPGETATVEVTYRVPGDASNRIQTDSLAFDLSFSLRTAAGDGADP